MKRPEFKKTKVFNINDLTHYAPQSVVMKDVMKKNTGNVSVISVDKGKQIIEELSRFDHLIHITEGKAEIIIGNQSYQLTSGQAIIIPANSKSTIIAHEKFKMISTIIKSGYE